MKNVINSVASKVISKEIETQMTKTNQAVIWGEKTFRQMRCVKVLKREGPQQGHMGRGEVK